MSLHTVGLNHTTAPLEVRERVTFAPDALTDALRDVTGACAVREAAILSTCNRTEVYFRDGEPQRVAHWLESVHGLPSDTLRPHLYSLGQDQSVPHAFRVASGLDSMVLGEPQILGQLKQAVREAEDAGTLGTTLQQMFQRSFAVAKEVRSSTEIGQHSISMAAAAVRLASQLFESLAETRVLFVGAGEMIELAAAPFAARQPRQIVIANRSSERAEALAVRFNSTPMPLADLPARLAEFDIVVSSTASSLPIIGLGAVERALKARRHRPMFMVDLAVPRDIEPEVGQLSDVYLYTVDDLSTLVQSAGEKRQAAVEQAEAIIETGVQSFVHWLDQRGTVPLIQALHLQADEWRATEIARASKMLAKGEDIDAVLEALSKALTQKMLHGTLAELHAADAEHRAALAQTVSRLFLRQDSRLPPDERR